MLTATRRLRRLTAAQLEFRYFETFGRRVQPQSREQPIETIRVQQGVQAANFHFVFAIRVVPAKTQRRQFVRMRVEGGGESTNCFPRRELAQTHHYTRPNTAPGR